MAKEKSVGNVPHTLSDSSLSIDIGADMRAAMQFAFERTLNNDLVINKLAELLSTRVCDLMYENLNQRLEQALDQIDHLKTEVNHLEKSLIDHEKERRKRDDMLEQYTRRNSLPKEKGESRKRDDKLEQFTRRNSMLETQVCNYHLQRIKFNMASKPKKARKANGYKMPAPIPSGFIVKNSLKKSWKVGTSIGKGGFGEIYCCTPISDDSTPSKSKSGPSSYPLVMKIEPQENGPLFVEMHFYMKVCKKEDIDSWMKSKGVKKLGLPCYLGSGSFEYKDERYRFVVMDRYGQDLWSLFLQNNKLFPCSTVLQIGLQVLDVLEYIHDQGYAHCDVKGANLLLGTQKGSEDQVYLVDFGLATRFITGEFKPDPKKAHNGTIEYTSRDAHAGVTTRRGDMEILGFNLLHWATSTLPWDKLTDPKLVEEKKKALMTNVSSSAKKLTPKAPPVVVSYLDYVSKLKHDQVPDYTWCRKLFKDELKKLGVPVNGKLNFTVDQPQAKSAKKTVPTRKKAGVADVLPASDNDTEEDEEDIVEATPEEKPKRTTRKVKEVKASWKDSQTAKVSNVIRAGEYTSTSKKPVKRQRNQ